MEDPDAEGDGYSDDDLDALPDHAFHELQENAVRSTQQPKSRVQLPAFTHSLRPEAVGIAAGFDRLTVGGLVSNASGARLPQQPSSDYGDFDDEMLEGEIFDAAEQPALAAEYEGNAVQGQTGKSTQREQCRQQRYSLPPQSVGASSHYQGTQQAANTSSRVHGVASAVKSSNLEDRSSIHAGLHNPVIQPLVQETSDSDSLQAQVQKVWFAPSSASDQIKNADILHSAASRT